MTAADCMCVCVCVCVCVCARACAHGGLGGYVQHSGLSSE